MKPVKRVVRKSKKASPRGRRDPVDALDGAVFPQVMLGSDRSGSKSRVRELSWAEFDRMVQSLARSIRDTFKPQAVVGLAHGGVFAGGAVASALKCDFYPVRISRRSRDRVERARPKLSGTMPKELKGLRVLVVDDVAVSGDTLELACELARKRGVKQVKTASLLQREGGFEPDFSAMKTSDLVVFPWDYEQVVQEGRFDVDPSKA